MEDEWDVVTLPCGHDYQLDGNYEDIVCSICNSTFTKELGNEFASELDLHEVCEGVHVV